MNAKLFGRLELSGTVAATLGSVLLLSLYELMGNNPVGVMFGAVNFSAWERMKTLVLSYFLYSGVELFSAKPPFHRFTAAKTFGLYSACGLFLLLWWLGMRDGGSVCVNYLASHALGFFVSYTLTAGRRDVRGFFAPACCMLMLIFVCYISFTAFPLKFPLFLDEKTGMYGIIPEYVDTGALSNLIV